MPAPKLYKNYINGEWVEPRGGKTFENVNPADKSDIVGLFPASDKCDLEEAVAAAKAAYNGWRLTPPPKRADILFRAAQMLVERKEELARDMTREMGKILKETRGDVQEAIDMGLYMAGEGRGRAAGGLRDDYAVELPHGHPLLEDFPRAHLRQHGRFQARLRHPALGLQLRQDSERGRAAEGRAH